MKQYILSKRKGGVARYLVWKVAKSVNKVQNATASWRKTGSLYPFPFTYVTRPINNLIRRPFRFDEAEDVPTFAIPVPIHVFHRDPCVGPVPFAKHTLRIILKYVQVGAYYLQHARISSKPEKSKRGECSVARNLAMVPMTESECIEKQREAAL